MFYVNNIADVVIEAANGSYDTVIAFVNYTLPANNTVEVLNMIGSRVDRTAYGKAPKRSSAAAGPTR